MEQAVRSVFLIRNKHPYTLICDDIRKDKESHLYEWILQLPGDLVEDASGPNEIILKEEDGDGRLLVRFLQEEHCEIRTKRYEVSKDRNGDPTEGLRLIASVNSVEPRFRVMLYPFREGDALPKTKWIPGGEKLTVTIGDHSGELQFSTSEKTGNRIRL